MKAIFRIDAAPGFEDSVQAALEEVEAVFGVVDDNEGNFDLVAAVEAADANGIQDVENAIRQETGVQGVQRVTSPDKELLARLKP